MNRRHLLLGATALATTALAGGVAAQSRRKPNFIIVLCDDLGYGDVGCLGGSVPTPNIDRMAHEGITLSNYYAPANLCTPSRAGLLTGRYPIRTGLGFGVILQNDDRGLPLQEKTIANALDTYATGLFGKWHLGHVAPYWPPTKHGFQTFFGLPYSHDMKPLALYAADAATGTVTSAPADLNTLQQQFYTHAEAFLEANAHRPFFMELALSAPHLPEKPSTSFQGKSAHGPYGDVLMEIDSIVGRLFAKLKALGLDDNTLVVFTSDNGPWFEGSSGPLRDRKGGAGFDGGSHVPCFARWPGVIPAGSHNDAIAGGIDWLPTLCAFAGQATPPGVELDGKDISAVLTRGAPSPHDELVLFDNEDVVAIRTQKFKYVHEGYWRGGMMNYEKMGYDELFDIENDRSESYSVAETYPEVAKEMRARYAAAVARFAPFRHAGKPPYDKGAIDLSNGPAIQD